MLLEKKHIEEFQKIYRQEFDEEISFEEASVRANELMELVLALCDLEVRQAQKSDQEGDL